MDRCGLHNLYEMCLDTLNNLFLNKGGARFGRVAVMFQHYTAGKAMCDKFTSAKVLSSQETPRLQILFQKYSGVSNFEKLRK
jgi:hypothetical protein